MIEIYEKSKDKQMYYIGVDPYDRLNWVQRILKKTGLFYKNRPKYGESFFVWREGRFMDFKNKKK